MRIEEFQEIKRIKDFIIQRLKGLGLYSSFMIFKLDFMKL